MDEMKQEAPVNLQVVNDPYPHLRDDEGCVLARDYAHNAKLAYILAATRDHASQQSTITALVEALTEAYAILSSQELDRCLAIASANGCSYNGPSVNLANLRGALSKAQREGEG